MRLTSTFTKRRADRQDLYRRETRLAIVTAVNADGTYDVRLPTSNTSLRKVVNGSRVQFAVGNTVILQRIGGHRLLYQILATVADAAPQLSQYVEEWYDDDWLIAQLSQAIEGYGSLGDALLSKVEKAGDTMWGRLAVPEIEVVDGILYMGEAGAEAWGDGHLRLSDPLTGRKTLSELAAGGGGAPDAHAPTHQLAGGDRVWYNDLGHDAGDLATHDAHTNTPHVSSAEKSAFHAQAHLHTGADSTAKLAQANTHESPDTDAATTSLHHTIGTTATKAAAGDHTHGSAGAYRRVQLVLFVDGTLTTGATEKNFRITAPETMAILKVRLLCGTAPTGAAIICDIHKNGTTIFTTQANRPQIAAGAYSGVSVAPDVTALAETDLLTFDIDQVGSTIAGADLTIEVICVAQAGGSVWFNGSGVPGAGTGNDGDYYLRTATGDVYQKAAGSWGSPIENLTGPTGPPGTSTFDALTDTPANKTGSSLKVVRVNAGETALEYRAFVHTDLGGVSSDQHHAAVTVADSTTIDLTLAGQQISGAAISQMSITADANGLKLSGDAASPGNNKVYGTDGAGAKGWKADPAGGGGSSTPTLFDTTGRVMAGVAMGGTIYPIGGALGTIGTKAQANDATTAWISFTTTAVVNNSGGFYDSSTYKAIRYPHNPTFISHVRTDASIAKMRMWIGLFSSPTALNNTDDPSGQSLAAFYYNPDIGPNIYCCTKDGTTLNRVNSGTALAASTAYWLKFVVDNGAGTVAFYINGVLVQTLSANLPVSTTDLGMGLIMATTETVAKVWYIAGAQCSFAA